MPDKTPLSPEVRALFQGKNFAHVATTMKDGSPQVTPVWIDIDENDRILVNTAEGRAKPRNMRRDPRVAISITDHEKPYQAAFIRGRVVEDTNEDAEAHIDFLSKKYTGVDIYQDHHPDRPRVIFAIEATHVATMGFD